LKELSGLTIEDYKQLVAYYKDKTIDLEFKFLLIQIENNKIVDFEKKRYEEELGKHKENLKLGNENLISKFNHKIAQLEKKLNESEKKIEKLKPKPIKK
jgi:predicted RNase H-like nuclease (RuvC/YqgF family)